MSWKSRLDAGRQNYVRLGACEPTFIDKVRPPIIEEVPPPTIAHGLDGISRAARLRCVKAILLGLVRAMLAGSIAVIEGCSAVAAIGWALNGQEIEDRLQLFIGVASETDESQTRPLVIFGHQMRSPSRISKPLRIRKVSKARPGTPAPGWKIISEPILLNELPAGV